MHSWQFILKYGSLLEYVINSFVVFLFQMMTLDTKVGIRRLLPIWIRVATRECDSFN